MLGRRVADGRGTAAGRADGPVGAADVRCGVVDRRAAARRVGRRSLADRSVAAQVGGRVEGRRRAGCTIHAAVAVSRRSVRLAAVPDRRSENPRTHSVAGATDLLLVVVDCRAAAGCAFTVHPAADYRPVTTHLP